MAGKPLFLRDREGPLGVPARRAQVGAPGAAHEVHDGAREGGVDDVLARLVHLLGESLVDVEVHLRRLFCPLFGLHDFDEVRLVCKIQSRMIL